MAKSNCPAEDSAPPQASAGQLTPRFLPLSLSGRLLQVTVAISPSAAKGASKERFSARIRSEGPRRQMQDFERWVRGELRFSCDKFLLAKGDLSFGGEVFLVVCLFVCFCRLVKGFLWPGELPFRYVFKRCICWGPSGLSKPENSEAPFSKTFQRGDMGG